MNFLKSIILVIIIAVIIGLFIVYLPKFLQKNNNSSSINKPSSQRSIATPSPTPSIPPVQINESSNLKDEINKIEIPDFTKDFDNLKSELK